MDSTHFEPHQSHLLSDGSTFPPVTPDPPPPPGYVDPLADHDLTLDGAEGKSESNSPH